MSLLPQGGSRVERGAALLFAAGVLGSLFALVHPWFDATNDGSMYILTARALLDGEGFTYNGTPFQIRPPGFSFLLVPVLAVFGTDFLAINVLVSLAGAAGVLLVYLFARERLGWPLALLTAGVVWLCPAYRMLCNQVMSDVPGIALLFLCLLVERWSDRSPSWRRDLVLGLVIGLSFYVRAPLLLLAPAVMLARIFRWFRRGAGREDRPRPAHVAQRLAVLAVATGVMVLPWSIRNRVHPAPTPAEQTNHYSYATTTWHTDTGDPGSPPLGLGQVLARIPEQSKEVLQHLGGRLHDSGGGQARTAIAVVLLGSVLLALLHRRGSAEIFVLGSVLIVCVSYHFLARHLLPVFVIALVDVVTVVRGAGERVRKGLGSAAAALVLIALLGWDLDVRPRWSEIEESHRFYADLTAGVLERLEDDARLGSPYGFTYAAYMDRPVYNLGFAVERSGVVNSVEDVIDKHGLNTVILSPQVARDRPFLRYFVSKYDAQPFGGVCVVRVRP